MLHRSSFVPHLPCNCSPFDMQKDYSCKANGLQLECKRGPFFIKCSFFLFINFVHKVCGFCNLLYISDIA